MSREIKSLYVCGNSFSPSGYDSWTGMLSQRLGFPFVAANNKAQGSAGLFNSVTPPRPGLMAQLRSMRGQRATSLLVVWLFPGTSEQFKPSVYVPAYTNAMDTAIRIMGFRMVLMPNYADLTKTAYAKLLYTPVQLAAIRKQYVTFNASYLAMVGGWKTRYASKGARFATVDVFHLWDGQGTIPDGLHPAKSTHIKFALWFYNASLKVVAA